MVMYAALSWFMTGERPQASSGETPSATGAGYVALHDVLTIVNDQDRRVAEAIRDLKDTFRSESSATRSLVETYRVETNRRLDALEEWRDAQEDAALIRQGKAAVTFGLLRLLAKHWQLVWALVVLLLGLAWTATGNQPIGVGPVTLPTSPAP